jgi:mono/diheme cytochrome c family protein
VIRGTRWKNLTRGRWIGIGCAAAWALAWVGLGQGGAMWYAPAAQDVLTVMPAQAAAAPGAPLYSQYCAMCHQASGQGMPGAFPSLVDDPIVKGDPHYLARVVLYGLQGRIVVNGHPYNSAMSGFAGSMNDTQIADVLTYIRSSWGNNAPEVSADVVKAERAVPGTPQDNAAKYPK